jgi:mono/diheme cytochrome c family protein
MTMQRWNQPGLWLTVCAAAALSACGGGGGGTAAAVPSTPGLQVATFIDAPVQGLEYSSSSTSGLTDVNGNFEYVAGESVTFQVGNLVLGSVTPEGDQVRPMDLVPAATSATDARVTRILQTLQTLDDDGDPENGISIPSGTREHLRSSTGREVHLDDESTTDADVEENLPTGAYTRTEREAVAHYEAHRDDESNAHQGYVPPTAPVTTTPVSTTPGTVTSVPQPVSSGGRLLASNCFQCHGTGGTGGFENIRGGEAREVFDYFGGQEGVASSSIMTAHAQGFTRAQLDAIVAYLQQ